jgi:hypothetical protein
MTASNTWANVEDVFLLPGLYTVYETFNNVVDVGEWDGERWKTSIGYPHVQYVLNPELGPIPEVGENWWNR